MHAMWSRWAPPMERSKLVALSYSGDNSGSNHTVLVITDYFISLKPRHKIFPMYNQACEYSRLASGPPREVSAIRAKKILY